MGACSRSAKPSPTPSGAGSVGPRVRTMPARLFESDGPRWFGPDRPVWRVHADASVFVGALRALLLQSLHPLAMAGVADHSDFRHDPWGRLQRTARFLTATTYGTATQAEEACATVRRVHRRVHGVAPDGRPYDANDPHLLTWVHIAEVDSFLAAYQRFGAEALAPAEADGYVEDMARVATALGVPDPPRSVAELRACLASYGPELAGTPAAQGRRPLPAAAATRAARRARAVHVARRHRGGAPALAGQGHAAHPAPPGHRGGDHPARRARPGGRHAVGAHPGRAGRRSGRRR